MPTPIMLALPNPQALFAAIAPGGSPARVAPSELPEGQSNAPARFQTFLAAALPPAQLTIADTGPTPDAVQATPATVQLAEPAPPISVPKEPLRQPPPLVEQDQRNPTVVQPVNIAAPPAVQAQAAPVATGPRPTPTHTFGNRAIAVTAPSPVPQSPESQTDTYRPPEPEIAQPDVVAAETVVEATLPQQASPLADHRQAASVGTNEPSEPERPATPHVRHRIAAPPSRERKASLQCNTEPVPSPPPVPIEPAPPVPTQAVLLPPTPNPPTIATAPDQPPSPPIVSAQAPVALPSVEIPPFPSA